MKIIIDYWEPTEVKKAKEVIDKHFGKGQETERMPEIICVRFPKRDALRAEAKRLEEEAREKMLESMTNDEICEYLTGYSPIEYQTKYGIAWNE